MLPKRGLEEITHKEQDKTEKGTHVANLISESTKKKKLEWMRQIVSNTLKISSS